jgi:hypothetical protein
LFPSHDKTSFSLPNSLPKWQAIETKYQKQTFILPPNRATTFIISIGCTAQGRGLETLIENISHTGADINIFINGITDGNTPDIIAADFFSTQAVSCRPLPFPVSTGLAGTVRSL